MKEPKTPLLRWVGGKAKLAAELIAMFPHDMHERTYCEPFFGGGSMYFALPAEMQQCAVLSDSNWRLMRMYTAIRAYPFDVFAHLNRLLAECPPLGEAAEQNYYRVRERFNALNRNVDDKIAICKCAALFIYLNKTCFNGVYRVNRDGIFNVPWGKRKQIAWPTTGMFFRGYSYVLNGAWLHTEDFGYVLEKLTTPKSFVYCDPPYDDAFDGYAAADGTDQHKRLATALANASRRGVKWMLSQNDTQKIRNLYCEYFITETTASRSVSCDGNRKRAAELIITNYEPGT